MSPGCSQRRSAYFAVRENAKSEALLAQGRERGNSALGEANPMWEEILALASRPGVEGQSWKATHTHVPSDAVTLGEVQAEGTH